MRHMAAVVLGKCFMLIVPAGIIWMGIVGVQAEPKAGLAVLPFLSRHGDDPSGAALCPICEGPVGNGDLPLGSSTSMTHLLFQKMEALQRFHVVAMENVEAAFEPPESRHFEQEPIPFATRLGNELGTDFAAVGYLYRFEERIGSTWGVERPASVGFHLHLIRVKDGKLVWTGKFDETQKPLSDDLMKIGAFLKRKASWLKAEELASVGMDEVLENLPSNQELLE